MYSGPLLTIIDPSGQVAAEHRACGAGHPSVGDRRQQRRFYRSCGVHQPGDRQDGPQHVLGERNRDPDLERPAALRTHRRRYVRASIATPPRQAGKTGDGLLYNGGIPC